jgi:hypothetical protein
MAEDQFKQRVPELHIGDYKIFVVSLSKNVFVFFETV